MLKLSEYTRWLDEINQQPAWRYRADREADYYDGNQLDSEIISAQRELGIPPAIEPLIQPTIDAVLGMEVRSRQDWRIVADDGGDEVAAAMQAKFHKSESKSQADGACADAYASQIKVGLGWVEVSRNPNPFEYPYRCKFVHRNEIWWDWYDLTHGLEKSRYLIRRKWMDQDQAALMFPEHKELITSAVSGWAGIDQAQMFEGGTSTDLSMSLIDERGWSIEEMEWLDTYNRRVCLFEVWYRVWGESIVLRSKDGRIIEMDPKNPIHKAAVATGYAAPERAIIPKMRLSWWLGPHKLSDEPSPYIHNKFPYVPFWGKREDRTGVPYGLIRGMMYLQDEVNARISKMQWLLSAVRTERTEGAVKMSDQEFNNEIARPDADIKLDANKMAQPGARFKVTRDIELNQQQFSRLVDARESIKRVGGVYNSFQGLESKGASSGVALNTLVDQSIQTLADINDNFRTGKMAVGDLLMSLHIEDMIGQPNIQMKISRSMGAEEQIIVINSPKTDENNVQYLDNDIERIKLKVTLEDVPSTPTFRQQQLQVLKEAIAVMPPQYQAVTMPFFMQLMDLPNRDELLKAIAEINKQITPEQMQEEIQKAVAEALQQFENQLKVKDRELKEREVVIKERAAQTDNLKKGIEAAASAMDTGALIATNPEIAPAGDAVIQMAGSL